MLCHRFSLLKAIESLIDLRLGCDEIIYGFRYLKHMHNTREAEKELMGDVPGWEVGKWFEYPVFHNPRNLLIKSPSLEYFGQMSNEQQRAHQYHMHWVY